MHGLSPPSIARTRKRGPGRPAVSAGVAGGLRAPDWAWREAERLGGTRSTGARMALVAGLRALGVDVDAAVRAAWLAGEVTGTELDRLVPPRVQPKTDYATLEAKGVLPQGFAAKPARATSAAADRGAADGDAAGAEEG